MSVRTLLTNALLLVMSVTVALAAGEWALSVFRPQELGVWAHTRDGMVIHAPDLEQHLPRFDQVVHTNSFGMRDRQRALEKPAGTFRILLLGDSFMEALQVRFEESLPSLLETALVRETGAPIEVLNASVSGWGTDDQLTYLARYGTRFQPDLVLLAMTLHNDVSDNLLMEFHSFDDGELREHPRQEMPWVDYAILRMKGFGATHSHLYRLLVSGWRSGERKEQGRALSSHVVELLRAERGSRIETGWQMTVLLLEKTARVARGIGAETAIFLVPLSLQVVDAQRAAFLEAQELGEKEVSLEAPQRVVRDWGVSAGVEVIDLLPAFREWTGRERAALYLADDGHWNPDGHALAAEVVARELLARGLTGAGT